MLKVTITQSIVPNHESLVSAKGCQVSGIRQWQTNTNHGKELLHFYLFSIILFDLFLLLFIDISKLSEYRHASSGTHINLLYLGERK